MQSNVSIHQRHLRFLITEIYKSISQLNPKFMWLYFTHKELLHCLRNDSILNLPRINSTYYSCYIIDFIVHDSSHFLRSTLYCSCFIFISFSPQSISFISCYIVHLIHIYFIWLHSYYMVIQPSYQSDFSANLVSGI